MITLGSPDRSAAFSPPRFVEEAGDAQACIAALRRARAKDLRTIRSMARALLLAKSALHVSQDPIARVHDGIAQLKRAAEATASAEGSIT